MKVSLALKAKRNPSLQKHIDVYRQDRSDTSHKLIWVTNTRALKNSVLRDFFYKANAFFKQRIPQFRIFKSSLIHNSSTLGAFDKNKIGGHFELVWQINTTNPDLAAV